MIYQWKNAFYKTAPDVAAAEFKRIDDTIGLTAENIVEESRNEEAPLHNEFEWRDDIAAEEYRKQQARMMLCSLTVKLDEAPNSEPVRAFVNITGTIRGAGSYEPIQTVLKEADKTEALLKRAISELNAFKTKYIQLQQLADVFAAINNLTA